jgi:hypothetical protein
VARKLSRSGEQLTFAEIKRIFEERKLALKLFFSSQTPQMLADSSAKERRDLLIKHIQETDYDARLNLFAAIEAAFRIDCDYCCQQRPKNPRAKAVRKMVKTFEGVPSHRIALSKLFEQLLANGLVKRSVVNRLKQFFKFRNWLAHGRYWTFKSGVQPAFADIYELAQAIDGVLYK